MVVDDLDINGSGRAFGPFETNPPLIIYADAVLTQPITPERLEPITW
jgi:hypothetical protein